MHQRNELKLILISNISFTTVYGLSEGLIAYYSRILLSRVPLTRENQLAALIPWTPNFSDTPLATAHMTDPR